MREFGRMNAVHEERKLLAILFTDVVGYTALTERDEARAERVLPAFGRRAQRGRLPERAGSHRRLGARDPAPTLVIHGRDDAPVPLDFGRKVASLIPAARFEIVSGGHLEGTGGSREAQKLILDFLADGPQQRGAPR